MKSKTNLFILIAIIFFIFTLSCNKLKGPSDVELKLTKYSWIVCKYEVRLADSSTQSMNELYLPETCYKQIFTYASDNKYHHEDFCDGGNHGNDYWQLRKEEDRILVFLDEENQILDHTYVIEKLDNDSLKLFIFNPDEPDNLLEGLLISYYSTEKIEY